MNNDEGTPLWIIDTHAHLDEIEDLTGALDRAREEGVTAIVAMGMDYATNYRTLEIAAKYPSLVFPALGLHPGELAAVRSELERNFAFIEDNLTQAVAVGEIGLDYHKRVVEGADKELQKQVFCTLLAMAKKKDKPVSIHSRYAWRDVVEAVRDAEVSRAVFHWYTGPRKFLREALGWGGYASATVAAEYHEEHRRVLREVPLDRLMLETDCPVYYRSLGEDGRSSQPADLIRVLHAVAELKEQDPVAIAAQTTRTAQAVFGLPIETR